MNKEYLMQLYMIDALQEMLAQSIKNIKLQPSCFLCKSFNPNGITNYLCAVYPYCIAEHMKVVNERIKGIQNVKELS